MKQLLYFSLFLACFFSKNSYAQTASIDKGCIPLEVDFTSPNGTTYYWDFGDGSSSDLQNPSHIFTNSGDYTVTLYDGVGGAVLGQLSIKVYADPIIQFTSNTSDGCSPLTVEFTSNIIIDDDITIESYLWAFGDGSSSDLANPTYTYTNAGDFAVSLQLTTSILECDQTVLVEDFIKVEGVFGAFLLDATSACSLPATFDITNIVPNIPGAIYMWDFGNGESSTDFAPGSVTYEAEGTYTIALTILNVEGCETTATREVHIGTPQFDLSIPDSVCLFEFFRLDNDTNTDNFAWTFGGEILSLTLDSLKAQKPIIAYQEAGWQTLTLEAWNSLDCVSDTTFMLYVQDPDPSFTVDPIIDCQNPMVVTAQATQTDYVSYEWDGVFTTDPTLTFEYLGPDRDTTYFNQPDTIPLFLEVTTALGCWDTLTSFFVQRRPEAYFLPSPTRGCAPLTVNFQDFSRSHVPINRWKWLFGTGDETEFTTGDNPSYTYEEPGEYYTKLVIENEAGCIDTSYGIWIYVGEAIESDYTIDKTEVCINEAINLRFENMDERIDAWHFATDDGRFNDCWTDTDASDGFFTEPGDYPLILEIEYNGCISTIIEPNLISVKGAKADIEYMINCDNPYDVMFRHESFNGTELNWTIADQSTSSEEGFVYTFAETGDYMIWLEANDPDSGCPSDTDSLEVFIRDIKADFELPEKVCDNFPYEFSAANSVDVDDDCHSGYLWILPSHRPRELGISTVDSVGFPELGFNEVTLVTTDINGCTDTITKSTYSYGIDPAFESDLADNICLPQEGSLQDLSVADTTIVGWDWSFGGTTANPTHVFTAQDSAFNQTRFLEIILYVEDALGCIDSTGVLLQVYNPVSTIAFSPDTTLCAGDTISFSATDYTEQGSFLTYEWDFGEAGLYTEQAFDAGFPTAGVYPLTVTYTEEASACARVVDTITITVIDTPIAAFETNADSLGLLCYPKTIEFTNTSEIQGDVFYAWDFGNGAFSDEIDPVITYDKGTFEATLYVQSIYGCFSTTTESFTLVGPEGNFSVSDTSICLGETVVFTLQDTTDIATYTWDFGDGTVAENQNPIDHVYNEFLADGQAGAALILESAATGCELIQSIPVNIEQVEANFAEIDSLSYCEGAVFFENLSVGADTYFWDLGDGNTSTEAMPTHVYANSGEYTVSLQVSSENSNCIDLYETDIPVENKEDEDFYKIPNVFSPDNGDDLNDTFSLSIDAGFEDFVDVVTFKVYNRWGNLVYDNERPSLGWDGTYKGKLAPAEIYAYYIEIAIRDCGTKVKKGNVTLIR